MRFPWQRRADEEKARRLHAEKRLREVEADWPKVREHAEETRTQKVLNGWTGIADALFQGSKK